MTLGGLVGWSVALLVVSLLLLVAGVALLSVPVALIVAGVLGAACALLLDFGGAE